MLMDYLYGVYCNDEQEWVYVEKSTEPTTCPNNPAHSIGDIVKVKPTTNPIVVDDATKGYYIAHSLEFNIPTMTPGDVYEISHTFNNDTLIWTVDLVVTNDMLNDYISILVANNKLVGILTAPCVNNATVLSVNSTVTDNITHGFFITLTDNSQSPPVTQDLGECLSVDKLAGTITVETPTSSSFAAGSLVTIDVYMIKKRRFAVSGIRPFSSKGLKAKLIPKDQPTTIRYYNMDGAAKTLQIDVERFYGF